MSKKLKPLPRWLRFKTHGGTDYFYDPTNEMIHYLAGGASKTNYAVDPVHNRTYVYDSYEHLQAQIEQASLPRDEREPVEGAEAGSAGGRDGGGGGGGGKRTRGARKSVVGGPTTMLVEQQV